MEYYGKMYLGQKLLGKIFGKIRIIYKSMNRDKESVQK